MLVQVMSLAFLSLPMLPQVLQTETARYCRIQPVGVTRWVSIRPQ